MFVTNWLKKNRNDLNEIWHRDTFYPNVTFPWDNFRLITGRSR